MRYSLTLLNITYELPFRQPVFQVGRSAVEILECFYNTINPTYPIAVSDLTATAANSMGDVAIRGTLFDGNGQLELTVEKFTARFEGLRNRADIETVKNAIRLSEEALEFALPATDYNGAEINASAWFACDEGEQGVEDLLKKFGTPKLDFQLSEFGAEKIKRLIRGQFENETEGWTIKFHLDSSEVVGPHLFFLCDGSYAADGMFNEFDGRAKHLGSVYDKLLRFYGLEPDSD